MLSHGLFVSRIYINGVEATHQQVYFDTQADLEAHIAYVTGLNEPGTEIRGFQLRPLDDPQRRS